MDALIVVGLVALACILVMAWVCMWTIRRLIESNRTLLLAVVAQPAGPQAAAYAVRDAPPPEPRPQVLRRPHAGSG